MQVVCGPGLHQEWRGKKCTRRARFACGSWFWGFRAYGHLLMLGTWDCYTKAWKLCSIKLGNSVELTIRASGREPERRELMGRGAADVWEAEARMELSIVNWPRSFSFGAKFYLIYSVTLWKYRPTWFHPKWHQLWTFKLNYRFIDSSEFVAQPRRDKNYCPYFESVCRKLNVKSAHDISIRLFYVLWCY